MKVSLLLLFVFYICFFSQSGFSFLNIENGRHYMGMAWAVLSSLQRTTHWRTFRHLICRVYLRCIPCTFNFSMCNYQLYLMRIMDFESKHWTEWTDCLKILCDCYLSNCVILYRMGEVWGRGILVSFLYFVFAVSCSFWDFALRGGFKF